MIEGAYLCLLIFLQFIENNSLNLSPEVPVNDLPSKSFNGHSENTWGVSSANLPLKSLWCAKELLDFVQLQLVAVISLTPMSLFVIAVAYNG